MDNTSDFITGMMAGNGGGFGGGWGGFESLFALLILPAMWGGNGGLFGNRNNENTVTEADLCNANSFSELKGSVGRLSDQVSGMYTGLQNGLCNIGYQELQNTMGLQRDLCQGLTSVVSSINAAAAQQAQCCCDTKQLLMENRYLAERNAANSDAVTVAQTQKILDAICGNRMADMQNQINQLQLQSALCGIPRTTPYGYGIVPQFANGCCGNGWNSGNI